MSRRRQLALLCWLLSCLFFWLKRRGQRLLPLSTGALLGNSAAAPHTVVRTLAGRTQYAINNAQQSGPLVVLVHGFGASSCDPCSDGHVRSAATV